MADTTVESISVSDARSEASALRDLAEDRNGWPLERYLDDSRTDWLRLWNAWVVVALAFVEALLAFRLGFKLAAANPLNGFVDIVYGVSGPLAAPFNGIVAASKLGAGSFEPSILVGMLVYVVTAVLLIVLVWAFATTEEARAHGGHRTTAGSRLR